MQRQDTKQVPSCHVFALCCIPSISITGDKTVPAMYITVECGLNITIMKYRSNDTDKDKEILQGLNRIIPEYTCYNQSNGYNVCMNCPLVTVFY